METDPVAKVPLLIIVELSKNDVAQRESGLPTTPRTMQHPLAAPAT